MKVVYFFLLVTTFIPSFTKNGIKANIITISQSVNDNCVTLNIWKFQVSMLIPPVKLFQLLLIKLELYF